MKIAIIDIDVIAAEVVVVCSVDQRSNSCLPLPWRTKGRLVSPLWSHHQQRMMSCDIMHGTYIIASVPYSRYRASKILHHSTSQHIIFVARREHPCTRTHNQDTAISTTANGPGRTGGSARHCSPQPVSAAAAAHASGDLHALRAITAESYLHSTLLSTHSPTHPPAVYPAQHTDIIIEEICAPVYADPQKAPSTNKPGKQPLLYTHVKGASASSKWRSTRRRAVQSTSLGGKKRSTA